MPALDHSAGQVRYPFMAPSELLARLKAKPVVYLPIGSLEWHNEHLPLGTDTLHAMELAERLARRVGGVVLPPFWWNTGGCHDHAVTYHMPEAAYRQTLKNVILGLRNLPAKLIVLINGHGGGFQKESVPAVAEEINREKFPIRILAADPYYLGQSSPVRIDHADTGETSIALELIPGLVRMDRQIGPDLLSKWMPFEHGQPTAEGGRKLWEAYFADASALIEKALA
jgi:creatinine amidohydrolase